MPLTPRAGHPLHQLVERAEALDPELGADLRVALEASGEGEEAPARGEVRPARYRILRDASGDPVELGRGGFGRVLRAKDLVLDREVALKVPRPNAPVAEAAAFAEEALHLASLSHPGLLPVHDLDEPDLGLIAIVMPIAPLGTLGAAVTAPAGTHAALADLLRAYRRVVETVGYLHEMGLSHGDIKGANVLLGAHGEVYLHDLGPRGADAAEVGTPGWLPVRGHPGRPRGPQRDIWQLGALLATICTGASTPAATDLGADATLGLPRPDVAVAWPAGIAALRTVACRCMTSRSNRFVAATAILEDLDAWEEGRRVAGHNYGALELFRLYARRHRNALIVASIGLLGTLVGAEESWRRWGEAERHLAGAIEEQARFAYQGTGRAGDVQLDPPDMGKARALAVQRLAYGPSPVARGLIVATERERLMPLLWSAPAQVCRSVSVVPTTGLVACFGNDGLALFDADGAVVDRWAVPAERDWPLWSADGTEVVVVGPTTLERWSAAGLVTSAPYRPYEVTSAIHAPDGDIALGYRDGRVELRDGASLAQRAMFLPGATSVNALAFQHGELLAASVGDWIRAIDPRTGGRRDVLEDRGARFLTVHGGNLTIAGLRAGGDPTLHRIDPATGEDRGSWPADAIDVARFASSEDQIVTSGARGPVSVWAPTGQLLARVSTMGQRVQAVAVSVDRVIAAFTSGGLYAWSAPPPPVAPAMHAGPVFGVAAAGNSVVSVGSDAHIRTWELPDLTPRCDLVLEGRYSGGLGRFSDGRVLVGDALGGLFVFTTDCTLTRVAQVGASRTRLPVLSPDERHLAIGTTEKSVYVLDTTTWGIERIVRLRDQNPGGIAFSPDGARIHIAAFGDEVVTIDLATGRETAGRVPSGGREDRFFVGLFAVGNALIAGGRRGELVRWIEGAPEAAQGAFLHEGAANAVAYDPRGERFAAGYADGYIALAALDGTLLAEWSAHAGVVLSLAFSEDGQQLYTGAGDGGVRRWDLSGLDTDWRVLEAEIRASSGLVVSGARVRLAGM